MLHGNNLPNYYWAEAINTSCYILNRILIRPSLEKTPYELWKKPHMNFGKTRNLIFVISKDLEVNALF